MANGKKLVIIDTDCGVDDAEALALAFSRPEFEILAVTCVAGNTVIDNVTGNVLRVIAMMQYKQVDVFRGCETPLLGKAQDEPKRVGSVHGSDGFGGIADSIPVDVSKIQKEHAVDALIRLVKQYPKQIALITLGPLTNIALAKRLWPDFSDNLKEMFIMGGNHEARGNVSPSAEFNFWFDVEAAFIVLNEFCCPLTLITWETCYQTVLSWEWREQWLSTAVINPKADFLNRLAKDGIHKRRLKLPPSIRDLGFHSCDLLAMAVFVDPNIITEKQKVYASVELWGKLTRGQVVIDWRAVANEYEPNVTLITKVDAEKLKPIYMNIIS